MALITDNEIRMRKNKVVYGGIIAALTIGIPIQVFPFVWLLSSSFKGIRDVFELPPRLIPEVFHFENYVQVFKVLTLGRYFYNTIFVAILTILIQCTISTLAAFSLSKLRPKGSNLILLFFLATMMIPDQALLIPIYITMRHFPITGWNFINTYWGVVLPWSAWAWPIFLMKGFFDGLPSELFDAAKIDGASNMDILKSIIIPLSKPVIAIVVLQTFLAVYQQFVFPLIMMPDNRMWTIMVAIYNMQSSSNFGWNLIMVLLVYATIPMLLIFLFAQKYLVQGIKLTGLKA